MMDQQAIYSTLATDPIFRVIVNQFVAELPARVEALAAALQSNDRERVRRLAHQLKGAAGSYGFEAVTDASRRLEEAVLDLRPMVELAIVFDELQQTVHQVRPGTPDENG